MKWIAVLFGLVSFANAQTTDIPQVKKYKLYDLGTLGGNYSGMFSLDLAGNFTPRALSNRGQIAGISLYPSGNAGSFIWTQGKTVPLPGLPNANALGGGSNTLGINDSGLVIGISNNGDVSPFNNQLYNHAVAWINGKLQPLGDFGGHDSDTSYVNDFGVIVGYAFNAIPDPYGFYGTQVRAAMWTEKGIQDLGTLGGTDAQAWAVNNKGQVIGISFLNTPPVPPFNQPQDNAFLWTDGVITDLGNLGGGFSTPTAINGRGQVSVLSFDSTNQFFQSYIWSAGKRTLLDSLGGHFVEAVTLNDAGVSAGASSDPTDTNATATIWTPSGKTVALGTVSGDSGSIALGLNQSGVVVGGSGTVGFTSLPSYSHAFVWQKNGTLQDLNTLIPAGSSLTLNVAYEVNAYGMIAGMGTTSSGDTHDFILIPELNLEGPSFVSAAEAPAAPGSSISIHQMRGTRKCRGLCN